MTICMLYYYNNKHTIIHIYIFKTCILFFHKAFKNDEFRKKWYISQNLIELINKEYKYVILCEVSYDIFIA